MASLIPGVNVKLGGRTYLVPPLSLPQVQRLSDQLAKVGGLRGVPNRDELDAFVEVIHAALSRNYPSLTQEELVEGLDLRNMQTVMGAIMGISGLVEASEGEEKPVL